MRTRKQDETPKPDAAPDRFERFAAAVGDLDSPFYDEERDRDVWNEASAVGFQLMVWGIPIVGAVSLWVARTPALPYATVLLVPWVAASIVTVVYAQRRAVDPGNLEALARIPVRLALFAVVLAGLGGGFLWAAPGVGADSDLDSFQRGAAQGGGAGLVAVTLVATVLAIRAGQRQRRAERR